MGELIRTTRSAFELVEAKLQKEHPAVLERIMTRAKILTTEVRFTVEPSSPDALDLAKALEGHGEKGRTASALDRIRATCLGSTAPKSGNETVTPQPALEQQIAERMIADEKAALEETISTLATIPASANVPPAFVEQTKKRLSVLNEGRAPSVVVGMVKKPEEEPMSKPEKKNETEDDAEDEKTAAPKADSGTPSQHEFHSWRELVSDLVEKVGGEETLGKRSKKSS